MSNKKQVKLKKLPGRFLKTKKKLKYLMKINIKYLQSNKSKEIVDIFT